MRTSSRIAINAATRWLATAANVAIGLVLIPFLLSQFGKEGFGLIVLLGSFIALTSILEVGIRSALSRHLAEQVSTGNERRFAELTNSALFVYLILGLTTSTMTVLLAPLIARIFNVAPPLVGDAELLVRIYAAPVLFLSFLVPVPGAILAAHNRFDLVNGITTATSILRGVLILIVLSSTDSGLYGWATVVIGTVTLSLLVSIVAARRVHPELRIHPRHVRWDAIRGIFSLGLYVFGSRVASGLGVLSDPIILTTFLGPSAVALYGPIPRLSAFIRPFVNAVAAQLYPLATDYHAAGRSQALRAVLVRGTRYALLLAVPLCVALGVFSREIARTWLGDVLGPDYLVTAQLLAVWSLVELLELSGGSQWSVLLGMNRVRYVLWLDVPLALANLVASIWLVRSTALGPLGVLVPTAVVAAMRRPVLIVYAARACGLPWRDYVRESYLRPLAVAVLLIIVAWAVRSLSSPETLVHLLGSLALFGAIVAPICWWIGFTPEDRSEVASLAGRAMGLLRASLGFP